VRSNRPGVKLAARVSLPAYPARATGRPVELLVAGDSSRHADQWERLQVGGIAAALERQLPAVRAQHGPEGTAAGAVITHLVLDLYSAPGRYDVCIDDLRIEGAVPLRAALAGAPAEAVGGVRPAAHAEPAPVADAAGQAAALTRGVLEVGGLPFFPRSLDHNGEPLAAVSRLGFNCVRLSAPATAELLEEARQAGIWLISPPPDLPDRRSPPAGIG
jgi:hypothetical protein